MSMKLEASWHRKLKEEISEPYIKELKAFLEKEKQARKVVYPPEPLVFNAFLHTPYDAVKVVIIGQDPYHGAGQAHGLSFSVPTGVKPPPSLVNIYKEIQSDIRVAMPTDYGNLTRWAQQGVLLLNAVLTVRAGESASHSTIGWMNFTDEVIKKISDEKSGVVFLLWGKFAHQKQALIDETKHHVLKAAHPSPFSAYNGFFGCKHFSQTNNLLSKQGIEPIDWKLLKP